jgi:hypothetical protein
MNPGSVMIMVQTILIEALGIYIYIYIQEMSVHRV